MAETVNVNFKGLFDASDIMSKVSQIQGALNKVKLPENLAVNFNKNFGKIEELTNSITQRLTKGFRTKSDVGGLESDLNKINTAFDNLYKDLGKVQGLDLGAIIKPDPKVTKQIDDLNKKLRDTAAEIQKIQSQGSGNIEKIVGKFTTNATQRKGGELLEAYNEGDLERVKTLLGEIDALVARTAQRQGENQSANTKANINNIQELKNAIAAIEAETGPLNNSLKQTGDEINNIQTKQLDDLAKTLTGASDAAGDLSQNGRKVSNELLGAAESSQQLNSELEQIGNRVKTFFSLTNGIMLFRRAIKSAYQTVSELDKAMTATAVVSNETVSSMWQKLSQYSDAARELGSTMVDVVKAQTLYVQQGLDMQQSMDLANETLKMARVAGIDATNATNAMTAALRGFNMELGKTSGQRVNDVYSRLAQITASDVNELSTAMTKVASIAHSANMEFETTSAFLAQIIETTREAPETAGTALKTVIARFSEVKKLFSEGELMGTDEEGTEIDVNKIGTALRTAGINLNEYFTGAKGLDDIFMELAQRWDSLTRIQQRYIATQAAGSRQQSRFIALMQNYSRTTQLVDAAYTSAGSGQEQFEKTLDSLEAKTNQMKTAWQEFVMGLANSDLIKTGIDLLTKLLNTINGLINALSGGKGVAKTFVSALTALAGFKLGRNLLGEKGLAGGLTKMFTGLRPQADKAGKDLGMGLATSFKTAFVKQDPTKGFGARLKQGFANAFTQKEMRFSLDPSSMKAAFSLDDQIKSKGLSDEVANSLRNSLNKAEEAVAKYGDSSAVAQQKMSALSAEAEKAGISIDGLSKTAKTTGVNIQGISQAATMAGGALLMLSSVFDRDTKSGKAASEVFKYMGIALITFGSILPMVSSAFQAFGISLSTTIMSIPIIGWIAAIITALIALIGILSNIDKRSALERAEDDLKEMQEAIQNAKSAMDDLNSAIDEMGKKRDAIDSMTKGTIEWQQAVADLNQQILDVVASSDFLSYKDIKFTNEGVMEIDPDALIKAQEGMLLRYQNLQKAELAGQVRVEQAKLFAAQKSTPEMSKFATPKNIEDLRNELRNDYGNDYTKFDERYYEREDLIDEYERAMNDAEDFEKYLKTATELSYRKEISKYDQNLTGKESIVDSIIKQLGYNKDDINFDVLQMMINEGGADFLDGMDAIKEAELKVSSAFELYAKSIVGAMGLNEGSTKEAIAETFITGSAVENTAKDIREEIEDYTKTNSFDENNKYYEAYEKWAQDTYSQNARIDQSGNIVYNVETDNGTEERTVEKSKVFDAFIMEQAAKSVEEYVDTIEDLMPNATDLEKKAFTGQSLTSKEADSLLEQMTRGSIEGVEKNSQIWNTLLQYANAQNEQSEQLNSELQLLYKGDQVNNATAGMTNQARQNILDQYNNILAQSGVAAAQTWIDSYTEMLDSSDITDEQKNILTEALSGIEWSNSNAIQQFGDTLDSLGLSSLKTNNSIQKMVSELAKAQYIMKGFTAENIKSNLLQVSDYRRTLENKEGTSFTKEEFDEALNHGIDSSQFVQTGENTWQYIGGSIEKLIAALDKNTQSNIEQGKAVLNNQISQATVGEKYRDILMASGEYSIASQFESGEADARQALLQLMNTTGVETVSNSLTGEAFDKTDIMANAALAETIYKQIIEAMRVGSEELKQQLEGYETELINTGTADEIRMNGGTEEAQIAATQTQAADAGLNIQKLQDYGEQIEKISGIYRAMALEIARDNMMMNQSLTELSSNWENWKAALESGNKESQEYSDALSGLRSVMKNMLGITSNLSDEFLTDEKTMELMGRAAEGDAEAIDELRKVAAADIITHASVELDEESTNRIENYLDELTSEDYVIGTQINDSEALDGLYDIMQAAGATADEIRDAFEAIGWEPEIDTEPYTLKDTDVRNGYVTAMTGFDEFGTPKIERIPISSSMSAGATIEIPRIRGKNSHVKATYKGKAKATATVNPTTPSGGGGGGGGKDKSKNWENPYDKYYNLEKDINELIHQRNKLQDRYNLALRKSTTTSAELRKSLLDQLKTYQTEYKLQQQMLKGRKEQLANVGSEFYTDDEGNKRTFKELGVTKYAWYNKKDNTVEIDWDALNKITDEKEGAAVEAYISRLEELKDLADQAQDSLDAIENSVLDILKENASAAADLAGQLRDAYVTIAQSNIDEMSALNDTISEQNSEIIDGIRESIDLSRQIRENTKKEKELSDMQNRLAYLRRDTSGANALEIKQLEKQLGEARESYVDTLVDQNLDKMNAANDKAEEQRQHQIELMEQQLEYWQKSGYWNEQIEKMVSNPKAFQQDILDTLETAGAIDSGILRTPIEKFIEELDLIEQINKAVGGEASAAALDSKVNEQGYTIYTKDNKKLVNMHYDEQTGTWRNSKVSISESDIDAKSVDLKSHTMRAKVNRADVESLGGSNPSNPGRGGGNGNGGNTDNTSQYGKASETTGTIKQGMQGTAVKAIQYALNKLGFGNSGTSSVDGKFGPKTKEAVQNFQKAMGLTADGIVGDKTRAKFKAKGYSKGGLVDYTGMAMVHGSSSKPEAFLNAKQTEMFMQLKDVMSSIASGNTGSKAVNGGDNYFEFHINVDEIASDYDVDQVISKVKKEIYNDAKYRNTNVYNRIR